MTTAMSEPVKPPAPAPRFYVEAHPGGGWTVRLAGHHAPVSRHDTEEEAWAKAAAYQRGAADAEDGAGNR